ncbi:MAG: pantoate--beta-alanine ligase [Rhodothalassiaceae bacterium]
MSLACVRSVEDLRRQVSRWRCDGAAVALVPTMGALHHGHLSLVEVARRHARRVAVSIFVNPKQFGAGEDFAAYPRQEEADGALLASAGADLIYAPSPEMIYPPGFATTVQVAGVSEGLEGDYRAGHFDGVATVVTKLLIQAAPDVAVFGEKDYQQLQLIRRLAADLDLPCRIVGAPLIREPDGLAASSRNAYLSPEQRAIAPALSATLFDLAARATAGAPLAALEAEGRDRLLHAGFDHVDYLTFRDAQDLGGLERLDRPARLLATARLGRTRLLDNVAVDPSS